MTRIEFSPSQNPLLSVVMVTYGGGEWLDRSLKALIENTDPCYEVIIVDNASPDGTGHRLLADVRGARLLLNERNIGFGPAANQGALHAVGRYLCFLNSDAMVQPGWLEPLIRALEDDPVAGAALPCLLNLDGSLQEAGSMVGMEGGTRAIGDREESTEFVFRFRRYVDYGSAACLVIRRSTFLALGGFDPAYPIAYYEDVDLCFSLSELGLRTVYEPRSRVVHVRGASSDRGLAQQLMESNRVIFRRRWGDKLAVRPSLAHLYKNPHRVIAGRDVDSLDRLLFIDDRVPHVDRGSGDPRMAKLLTEVADLWPDARVTLFAVHGREAERYARPLLERGIEVVAGRSDWEDWLASRRFHYSVVVVSRPNNAEHFDPIIRRTQPQALRVYDCEALFFRRMQRQQAFLASRSAPILPDDIDRMREVETQAIRSADTVFCVSEEEMDFVRAVARERPVFLLPDYVEIVDRPRSFHERRDLIFFAGFLAGPGSPNEDGLLFLVNEVMPVLWAMEPEIVLHVVGAEPTPAVRRLHGGRVNVVGFVRDPSHWLGRARVHAASLRFGAGVKSKAVETMRFGLPFVTSKVGAEGLGLGDLEPLLVADEPHDIAHRLRALYTRPELWEHVQQSLLDLARERFSRARFRRTLVEAMTYLGLAPPDAVGRGRRPGPLEVRRPALRTG
jgi:O-antigen biosynthesis protein